MAKRFVDTALWDKPWFRKLPPAEKEAWRFICDKCDAVGVWEADIEIAEAFIGSKIDWDHLRNSCNGNIKIMKNGKWLLVDFVPFQYGELVDTNNAHRSYLSLLKKHGLSGAGQGQTRGYQAPLDKEKEKDMEKVMEKEPEKEQDKELYRAIEKSFLSKNGDRFTNYGKEGKAIHGIIAKAKARDPVDPVGLVKAMLDSFWALKQSGDKFYSAQPFTPSALNASGIWDRVLETMRNDTVDPAILAIIKGAPK
jgi:hypothetical protein